MERPKPERDEKWWKVGAVSSIRMWELGKASLTTDLQVMEESRGPRGKAGRGRADAKAQRQGHIQGTVRRTVWLGRWAMFPLDKVWGRTRSQILPGVVDIYMECGF